MTTLSAGWTFGPHCRNRQCRWVIAFWLGAALKPFRDDVAAKMFAAEHPRGPSEVRP